MRTIELTYPVARRDDTTDDYFGTEVADPYRWLEDDRSDETVRWVAAENEVTRRYLSQFPERDRIAARLAELWDYPKYGIPERHGDSRFFFENDGLRNQSVLYRQRDGKGPEVFLDPNTLSEEGTVALTGVSFSRDNRYMAFSAAESGSDWVELRIKELATGDLLPDRIRWVKFSGAVWSGDGFYYSGYDRPAPEKALSACNHSQKVFFHRIGTDQSADRTIYCDEEHPLRYLTAAVSRDDRQLFVTVAEGTCGNEVLYRDLSRHDRTFRKLFFGFTGDYALVYAQDDRAIFHTNQGAPNGRLLQVDFSAGYPEITELLAASDRQLVAASVAGGALFAHYLDRAHSAVVQYDLGGRPVREVRLPGIGTVTGFSGGDVPSEIFYAYASFTQPPAVYRYDPATGASEPYRISPVKFSPEEFVVERHEYESRDGTRVPMFLAHRKELERNGENPVYLYGYGGFNINLTPGFSPLAVLLMEQGGIYAVANLRGGGEFGERWHRAGMLSAKQNVFDDFIAAAEYLIDRKYTAPHKLAIAGGSNGGLLVGACMVQRPDLFAVALPAVGVMDMLRYHKFTVGWGWVVEYGRSDRPADFEYLYRYSPLHNIRPGTCYPATLVTTADHDDRVVPAHSFKFAATLQAAQGCDRPVLIRIDTAAGHGLGKPTAKRIDEQADVLVFLFRNTGTEVK